MQIVTYTGHLLPYLLFSLFLHNLTAFHNSQGQPAHEITVPLTTVNGSAIFLFCSVPQFEKEEGNRAEEVQRRWRQLLVS